MENLTHFDSKGNAIMVDVSDKSNTSRQAIAKGKIFVNPKTLTTILEGKMSKGDVLGVARVAGIMASKQTHTLIPMCHPLLITKSTIDFEINKEKSYIEILGTVRSLGQTGVEMEALTSVNVAALTIYDMCKAIDKEMVISEVYLHRKEGGKSGKVIYERFQD